jgi:cytochrome P450
VNKAFTPRQVETMRPRIEAVVDELLDEAGEGRIDIMAAVADPLPTVVIAEMLGVPAQDRARFKQWSDAVARQLEPTTQRDEHVAAFKANSELREYFDEIIEQRRAEPQDDLISALIAAEEEGDKLTREEMVSTLVLILVAGNETTTNLIGNGLLALLRHPDQLERLRDDPGLMENAVEEMLRYDSPVQTDGRTAIEDVVVGGREIEAGQQVVLLLGAANHDPAVFDDPGRLDLGRDAREHVAFARGNHYCLGSPLARAEGQIAFDRLLERYSEMRLAAEPEFKDHIVLRGMTHLWVDVERDRTNGAGAASAEATPEQAAAT